MSSTSLRALFATLALASPLAAQGEEGTRNSDAVMRASLKRPASGPQPRQKLRRTRLR